MTRTGEVFCWGWNKFGQCGRDPLHAFTVPKPNRVRFSRGCENLEPATVVSKQKMEVVHPTRSPPPVPPTAPYKHSLKSMSVSAGDTHCLAMLRKDKSVWKWGAKVDGATGSSDVGYEPLEMER